MERKQTIEALKDARSLYAPDSPKYRAITDAIIMMEAPVGTIRHPAKLMSLEEVEDNNLWDFCYLEMERMPGKEYQTYCGKHELICATWPSITSARLRWGDKGYGKHWRCWWVEGTHRPSTNERRMAEWK